jgi:hypothetical protein
MRCFSGGRKQTGQSSVIVLLMVALLFFLGSTALNLSTNTRKTAALEVKQAKAYYIAEAGVEKVLAELKKGPVWMKDLTDGYEYDFIANKLDGDKSYADGVFEKIIVKKTIENAGVTTVNIESWGKYLGSLKKLKVDVNVENVYAENYLRGIWLKNGNTPCGHVFDIAADTCFSDGDTIFLKGSDATGNIYCRGKLTLESAEENTTLINGDIFALGGLEFTGSSTPLIAGYVYVDNAGKAPPEVSDITVILSTAELSSKIPAVSDFPGLLSSSRLKWYQNNAGYDRLPSSNDSNRDFMSGIYYLEGDQSISGTYSGNAIIVINGSVSLGGLRKNSDNDCLAILAAGTVSSDTADQEIDAIIYAGTNVDFAGGITLQGCILSPGLAGQGSRLTVVYDRNMCDKFKELLNWTTCFIKVTKWSE